MRWRKSGWNTINCLYSVEKFWTLSEVRAFAEAIKIIYFSWRVENNVGTGENAD